MRSRIKAFPRFTLAALLSVLAAAYGHADLYAPNRPLLEIRTERFAIAFPPELEETARRLASFADSAWEEVAAKLDPEGAGTVRRDGPRIPVMLTPDSGVINAYRASSPYGRIVLYAAPAELDSTLGSFDDDLRSAFLHELTHELSLSIRSPFWRAAAAVLGDAWAPAALWTASPPMIEGVTTAFESEAPDGGAVAQGRANDPLSMATVRQDLAEGVRRSWAQASGAGDRYPWGANHYHYGGAFSRWLRETRGPLAYAALWKELGAGRPLEGEGSNAFSSGAFERAYGEDLDELWTAFLVALTPRVPLLVPRLLEPGDPGLRAPTFRVVALAAGPGALFVADASRAAVFAYPADGGPVERLFAIDGYVSRLDASTDGTRLLVSYARTGSGQTKAEARVWNLESGRWADAPIGNLAAAAFSGASSIVGLEPGAFEADLVEVLRDGSRRILLEGGSGRTYGAPVPLPDGSIAFAADLADLAGPAGAPEGGRRWTVFRLLPDGTLLELAVEDDEGDALFMAGGELGWPRFLSRGRGDGLLFSVARDDGFYRLARLEGGALQVMGAEISGGVQRPVELAVPGGDRAVAYLGAFSDGERLCLLDPAAPELETRAYEVIWRAFEDNRDRARTADPGSSAGSGGEAAGAGTGAADAGKRPGAGYEVGAWNPWPWILRPLRWPVMDVTVENGSFRARGLGAGAMFADPAERWIFLVESSWDFAAGAADLYAELAVSAGPFSVTLAGRDGFSALEDGSPYRLSAGAASLAADFPLVPYWRALSARLTLAASRLAEAPSGDPYGGEVAASFATLDASAAWSSLHRETRRGIFGEERARAGFRFALRGTLEADAEGLVEPSDARPAFEGAFELAEARSALSFAAWAAWAPLGGAAFGPGGRVLVDGGSFSPSSLLPWYPVVGEFAGSGPAATFYAQLDARLTLAAVELQGPLPLLPVYLARTILSAGARSALGPELFQPSVYGRLELSGSPPAGGLSRIKANAAAELGYAFGRAGAPGAWGWTLGLEIGY